MRTLLAVALLVIPTLSFGHWAKGEEGVLPSALDAIEALVEREGYGPAVLSARTRAGGNACVGEFAHKYYGVVVGEELTRTFRERNASPALIDDGAGLPIEDIEGLRRDGRLDWAALQELHPGVRSIVEISRIGTDDRGGRAVIRADITTETGARSFIISLEKRDGWQVDLLSSGSHAALHAPTCHTHASAECPLEGDVPLEN